MPGHTWDAMFEIFFAASELEPDQRESWLETHCTNPRLRAKVAALLDAHDAAGVLDGSTPDLPVDGSAASPRDESSIDRHLVGSTIGPYRVDEILGEGGMGTVYAASQTVPIRRRVALKVIKAGMDTRDVVARFETERQALAMMDHPHIATVHDGGLTETGRPFFVMELVDGEPITAYCDRHRLSVAERIDLFLPICRAVQHAHQKGIVHRDLKPQNLLVSVVDGRPIAKVIDFGIAKALDDKLTEQTLITGRGLLLGTPEYMSPEQAAASPDLDTRTDVYALGMVLYEVLGGVLPFQTDRGWLDVLNQVLRHEAPPMSRRLAASEDLTGIAERRSTTVAGLRRQLGGDLDRVVAQAIDKEPESRYASASELAADLERHLADEPVSAGSPSSVDRLGKFVRRHRLEVTGAALVLLLSLTFGAVMTVQARQLATALEGAERERDRSAEVTRFLVESFTLGDPAQTAGYDPPASEILERGAERLDDRLGDDPEIRAALLANFTEVYTHLGELDRAIELGRQSLALRCAAPGDARADVADSLYHLANALAAAADYPEATRLARESLDLRRQVFGAQSVEVAQSLVALGQVLAKGGEAIEAEAVHRQALAMRRALLPADDHRIGSSLNDLGYALVQQGRRAEAIPYYRQALEHGQRVLEPGHILIATRMRNLGQTLATQGELDEAETWMRRSLEAYRAIFGDDHAHVASVRTGLASLLHHRGRSEDASELYEQALDAQRQHLGSDHPSTATTLTSYAVLLRQLGEVDQAIAKYREAVPIFEKALGADHWRYGQARHNLGVALREAGDLDAAAIEFEAALRSLRSSSQPSGMLVAEILSSLGVLARGRGEVDRAIQLYHEALAELEASVGRDHWRYANVSQNLAVALRESGDLDASLEQLRNALAGMRASLGDEHRMTGIVTSNLGLTLCLRGDHDDGIDQLGEAARILQTALGAEHWRTVQVEFRRGQCHALDGRLAVGEPLMAVSLDTLRQLLGAEHRVVERSEAFLIEQQRIEQRAASLSAD